MKHHLKLLPYLRPYRLQFIGVVLFAAGATGMSLLSPWLIRELVVVVQSGDESAAGAIVWISLGLLVAYLLRGIIFGLREPLFVVGEFEKTHVLEIHFPPRGALGGNQVLAGDDVEFLSPILHLDAVPPRILEAEARSLGLDVYADSILENSDLMRKEVVHGGEGGGHKPGLAERVEEPPGVAPGGFDEDVEVERGAWHAVQDGGDSAYDDVLNPMLLKGREYARETV